MARSPEGRLVLLRPLLLLPSASCSSLQPVGGLCGAGDSRDAAEQSGWQGPRGVPASSVLKEDKMNRELCFPKKAEKQKPPVCFLEHHLGFEAGLWAGSMKCQY